MQIMNCQKCNFQNKDDAQFCVNCGAKTVIKPKKKQRMPAWIICVFLAIILAIAGVAAWYYHVEMEKERVETAKKEAAENYFNKGKEAYGDELYDLSISYYTKAIEIDSNFVKAYNGLADSYINTKNYELANQYAQKVLSLDPDNYNAFCTLAIANEREYSETVLNYAQKALSIDPDNYKAYRIMGDYYARRDPYNKDWLMKSISYFKKSLKLYINDGTQHSQNVLSNIHVSLCYPYMFLDNKQECETYFQKAQILTKDITIVMVSNPW